MPSRRTRRRIERQRADRPPRGRSLSLAMRLALIIGGVLLIIGGIVLIGTGGSANAARLGRVSGILIIFGLGVIAAGVIGRI
ncbi:MAG: hypothetical protein ACRDFX_07185 [Chloroflexota bacterium]